VIPTWSADGRAIHYTADLGTGQWDVWRFRTADGVEERGGDVCTGRRVLRSTDSSLLRRL
jgi:hypothetical protein